MSIPFNIAIPKFNKDLDEMVLDNLGKDLTPALREFIFEKYGHNCGV